MRENFRGFAAQQHAGNAPAAVGCHDDKIALVLGHSLDDSLVGMLGEDMHGIVLHATLVAGPRARGMLAR